MNSDLFLDEDQTGHFSVEVCYGQGLSAHVAAAATPAEELIAFVEIDYSEYRRAVQRLRDEHPLFEERPIIRVEEPRSSRGVSRADFDDFTAQASALPFMLRKIDPVGFFRVQDHLRQVFQSRDDNTARYLLDTGGQALRVLWEPVRAQIHLRNIFEMIFDGTERLDQQARFEKLKCDYPDAALSCDPSRVTGKRRFIARDLLDLRLLELALYFRQDQQRIARCEYCWGYFIPKTKKETLYCDRVTDGYPCKQRGSRFKRNKNTDQDEALLEYKKLRDRMYARMLRYQDASPGERDRLIPMNYGQYEAWSENARLARIEYLEGSLTGEEFLQRIDTMHDLESYTVAETRPQDEESVWRRMVARSIGFDPEKHYPETMIRLDLSKKDPAWEVLTADDLRRRDQEGHQSLREKYGKG